MSDLVQNLRSMAREYWQHGSYYKAAADEIERLRGIAFGAEEDARLLQAEIGRLRAELSEFTELKEYAKSLGQETYLELHAKNERLRAALEEMIEITKRNSEAGLMLIAIRRCAEHALGIRALKDKPIDESK